MGREATSKPAPFANDAKGCGTRKIKGRTKTSQLQDELPEWVHRGRGVINEGKQGFERLCHPPGSSQSFNEGCKEYETQESEYEECEAEKKK
jgi:hypothetical protein